MENNEYPKVKAWEREPNHTSAMRVALLITMAVGAVLMFSAISMAFVILFTEKWEAINMVNIMFTSGGGMFAIGELAKGIQSRAEHGKGK